MCFFLGAWGWGSGAGVLEVLVFLVRCLACESVLIFGFTLREGACVLEGACVSCWVLGLGVGCLCS